MYLHLDHLQGVEYKLYTFFGISDGGDFLSELNLMRDVVMTGSLLWYHTFCFYLLLILLLPNFRSLSIILTALVKYWYQAKNLAVSIHGQVGVYYSFYFY